MKQLPFYCAVLLICTAQASAQNLVPNPGFEIALEDPEYSAAGVNTAPFWFAHTGSPDFVSKN